MRGCAQGTDTSCCFWCGHRVLTVLSVCCCCLYVSPFFCSIFGGGGTGSTKECSPIVCEEAVSTKTAQHPEPSYERKIQKSHAGRGIVHQEYSCRSTEIQSLSFPSLSLSACSPHVEHPPLFDSFLPLCIQELTYWCGCVEQLKHQISSKVNSRVVPKGDEWSFSSHVDALRSRLESRQVCALCFFLPCFSVGH